MKDLYDYVNESLYYDDDDEYDDYNGTYDDEYDEYEQEYKEYESDCKRVKTVLTFENQSALMLFKCEFAGQISDGEWENAEPEYHWLWLTNYDMKIGKPIGFNGIEHVIDYDVSRWFKIWEKNNYDFAYRIFNYAKIGAMLPNQDKLYNEDIYELLGNFAEYLPEKKTMEYEEYLDKKCKYHMKYYNKIKDIFTKEMYDNFFDFEYTMNDLKLDLESCEKTLNKQR